MYNAALEIQTISWCVILSFGAKSDQSFATHPETRTTLNRMIAEIPAALIIQAGG